MQHGSGLLQVAFLTPTTREESAWSLLRDAGKKAAVEGTHSAGDISPLGLGGVVQSTTAFSPGKQHVNSRRWIIPILIMQRPPWISSVINLVTHFSLPQGSAPIGAVEPKQDVKRDRKNPATAAPGLQWNCQLLPQKSQNRSQTGVGGEQYPFLNPPASYMHTALTSWLLTSM